MSIALRKRMGASMARFKRERTDNWELIQQWRHHPEQRLYESIRPITLHGLPPAERALEKGFAESTLRRAADALQAERRHLKCVLDQ